MSKTKICVIGAGGWGKNHIKTLSQLNALGGIVEPNEEKRKTIHRLYPDVDCFKSFEDSTNVDLDGFVIATPPATHRDLAIKILNHAKPVLVEKPLTLTLDEAESIQVAASGLNRKLLVGHLLLFHPAILKMKEMINNGDLGDLQYIYSNRLNLGVVRKEENVFWSFAPHDISLFQFFTESFPNDVQSSGGAFIQENIHDTTITYLNYPNGVQGHIYVSWLHPFKEHRLVVIGSKGSLHFEDSTDSKPLLFYEKDMGNIVNELSLKNKPSKIIKYEKTLPLTNELKYFIDVIGGKPINKASLKEGIDVVKILEIATASLIDSSPSKKSPLSKGAHRNEI
ncbi:MAG: Gfo/Idh/MocA family oxidoreductase [Candidatus Marinimicrobia bacterium]|nr:Gfo/Idh/MocA family oxidoreductase [Candidatus Neomarinimicrobiota bacterium]